MDQFNKKKSVMNEKNRTTIKKVWVSALIIAFFVGIVLAYYNMLYNQTRDTIIKNGQSAAIQSKNYLSDYLSTSIDAIKLTAYSIDGMIKNKKTNKEILEYLVGQSTAVTSAIFENTTGLYAYVNGEYLDGAMWVPDEGFVATERPWYIKTMASNDEVTLIDPYLDAQTGKITMTIAKKLVDGKSIVAMDIVLDQVQNITEESVKSGKSDYEFILDSRNMVVAHSEKNEIGKNYSDETEGIWAVILENAKTADNDYFEFDFEGAHYVVYSEKIENDWRCLTVKNATEVFAPLKILLMITIIVVVIVVLILVYILNESNQRYSMAKELNEQLSSLSKIYLSVYNVDVIENTFKQIQSTSTLSGKFIKEDYKNASSMLEGITRQAVNEISLEDTLRFINIGTLRERLKDFDTVAIEYLNIDKKWRRMRFVASQRLDNGDVSNVLWLVEDIDKEKKERDVLINLSSMAKELNEQLASLSKIYLSVYNIDVSENAFKQIQDKNSFSGRLLKEDYKNASSMMEGIVRQVVNKISLEDTLRFINIGTLRERLKDFDTVAIEYQNIDKKWRRMRFVASQRLDNGDVSNVLWLVEDIDKEKKERDVLINLSERAFAASEAKSSFLSNMSHEIRTPINAILGMNEVILRECNDPDIIAYSESIKTAGNTLLGIINDILDFSKIEAGKIEIIPADYDLSSLINDLVNMIQIKADDKGLILSLEFDKDLPKMLCGDEVRIKQVITNILTNSVKYTEKGIVTFSIGFKRVNDEPDSVILSVVIKDTGIGIKPDDMKKLFVEFERIEENRNRNIEGTGLGMAITQNLLYLMKSHLKVESVYGLGTKFSFELKQKVIDWEPLGDYVTSYKAGLRGRKKYKEKFIAPDAKVLVVDDNSMNLKVFKNLLKQTKIQIDTAISGDEGLKFTNSKKYDMIFLDHMMPEKDGIETLHELRAQKKNPNINTNVICLTANAVAGAREKYLAEGFDNYLTKPINPNKLEEMILEYLPKEKIGEAVADNVTTQNKKSAANYKYLNTEVGLEYSAGMEDIYRSILETFCEMETDNKNKLRKTFDSGDWKNYTIFIHALKSTSLQIGGEKLSAMAKELEMSSKAVTSEVTSESEKIEAENYIKAHHSEMLELYEKLLKECKQYLNQRL